MFGKLVNLKNKISLKLSRSGIAVFFAYLMSKVLTMKAMAASNSTTTDHWQDYATSTGNANTFANIFNGFVSPLADFAAVILVISAVVCGMKIGAAAMTGDSRTRTSAIVGLFFIIIGAVVVIHAREIVGMANNININNTTGGN